MDDSELGQPKVQQIKAELAASEAEARAGMTVPLDEVLDRIRASVAQTESKQQDRAAAKA